MSDTPDEFEFFLEKHWSDGLPVVTPTEERVARMLTGTTRAPDELIGLVPPAIVAKLKAEDDLRVMIYVGHDTNLANIGGLLDIHWVIQGFKPDDPSPGGALAFELLRNVKTGARFVRLAYFAQTMDQMRTVERLDFDHPASRAEIDIPNCSRNGAGLCPIEKFAEIAGKAIDSGCVPAAK